MAEVVAIAGGGASGVLAAAALIETSPDVSVAIVEPNERLGRGVAYGTSCLAHLLNVPAGKISAYPDRPDHFVRWLATNLERPYSPDAFVPRAIYGDYLTSIVDATRARAPERFRHVRAMAGYATVHERGVRIMCSNGVAISADALIVATGNAPPARWRGVSETLRSSRRFFDSTWEDGALEVEDPNEPVVLLGSGLTAIDAALGLRKNGHRGPVAMLSRRGLLPHEHRACETADATVRDAATARELLAAFRRAVRTSAPAAGAWRGVIDDARTRTNERWQSLPLDEQRRFLRHALTYWNVHRHRMPPDSAREIAELMAAGTLRVLAGRIGAFTAAGDALHVGFRPRGSTADTTLVAGRAINCSGSQLDVRKSTNPLLRTLLESGEIVPHALGIGVRTTPNGAFVNALGVASERLFALGPIRFGTLFETTAMPEIRVQARELAATLVAPRFRVTA